MSGKRKKPIIRGRVKDLRIMNKQTQMEFAEEIGVSTNTISRIEQHTMSLTSDVALKIAEKYKISLDWLFYRSDIDYSPERQRRVEEAYDCMEESWRETPED